MKNKLGCIAFIKVVQGVESELIVSLCDCLNIIDFWERVLHFVGHIIDKTGPPDPKLCILKIFLENSIISKDIKSVLNICPLEAKLGSA